MPTSIDPQPAENEFECANCGAYFHYELTRCPNCGVNLYEPEGEIRERRKSAEQKDGLLERIKDIFHGVFNKPYSADQIFGDALDASILYNDLLSKVGGDREIAERLIEFERGQAPGATRRAWVQSASQRWNRDNRTKGNK